MNKYFITKMVCLSCSLLGIYFSTQKIIENKTNEFELNNSLITTSFNNNLVDSVKYEKGKYRVFLLDEDLESNVYSKHELSSDNITLLNRISFQNTPMTTKNHILNNLINLIEYQEIEQGLSYFRIKSLKSSMEDSSLNELEFKVEEKFNDKEIKLIKKSIRNNKY